MKVVRSEIPEVLLLAPRVFEDARGAAFESYNRRTFKEDTGLDPEFVQDNRSTSRRNVLRGLHYQVEKSQGKLISVLRGEIYDVAVDLRRSSPNFGQWVGFVLSEQNKLSAWVPPGFAHGFVVLSDSADFLYKTTDFYAPQHERSIVWNDRTIGIEWPVAGNEAILSAKDAAGQPFGDAEYFD